MAILGKIQKSSGALIIVIGLALFAFVIQGLIKNSSSLFRPSQEYVGKINGEKIPTKEFQQYIAQMQKQMGTQMSSNQIMRQAWDYFVNKKLLEDEFKKTGIMVAPDRIFDQIKNNPYIRKQFTTAQGVFDENQLIDYMEKVNQAKNENPQAYENWVKLQKDIEEAEGQKIFDYLVKGAINPTIKEGEWAYRKEADKVSFDFVTVPYSQIPDSVVNVTDEDIKNYLKQHADLYHTKENRDILFVKFDNKPSKSDYEAVKQKLAALIEDQVVFNPKTNQNDTVPGFLHTNDPEAFAKKYSDQFRPVFWYTEKDLPKDVADTLMKLPKGAVFGPYLRKNVFYLYKIVDKKENVPAKATASHILFAFDPQTVPGAHLTEQEAKQKADSVLAVLKKDPSKFEEMVRKFSDDKASVPKGGKYENFAYNKMVEPFSEFVFSHKEGDMGIVKTRFGYHLIRVDDLDKNKISLVKLAEINKEVTPSDETLDSIYSIAAQFAMKAKNEKDLAKTAKEEHRQALPVKKIFRYESHLPGLGDKPEIVRWLYNDKTEIGDIKRFDTPEAYIVVQYTGRTPEGLMPVEEAAILVKPKILAEKKFEYIKAKMKGNSLDEIAKNSGGQKGHVDDVTLDSPMIPGMGKEPVVVAVAFVTPMGKISDPVQGNYGAFVVSPTKKTPAPKLDSYMPYIAQQKQKETSNLFTRLLEALKKKAKIKDNRAVLGY
ncbi:MAG: hypothetical protein GXO24_00290 [Chlorobi bacterium]|nr:hypothetical protein [Chlorobiota bacterium]